MALNNVAVGKAIADIRKARGMTQREVATRSGLTVNYLSLLENGQRGASVDVVNKLAAPLGVPAEFIFFLAGDGRTGGNKPPAFRKLSDDTAKAILAVLAAEAADTR